MTNYVISIIDTNSFVGAFQTALQQPNYVHAFFLGMAWACPILLVAMGASWVRAIVWGNEDI